MPSSATRLMPTPSSTASFTTLTASISPARVSDDDAPDRSHRIDHQPATLPKIYCQPGARQPGDIISYRRATSSRNQRATSSESTVSAEQSSGTANCVGHSDTQSICSTLPRLATTSFRKISVSRGRLPGEAGGSESQAIQNLHQQMMNEGLTGGHYQNIMSRQFTTIGIGLYYVNGVLWLTEDFVRP